MNKKIILVVGSGRSGTSAITRGLLALDVSLGDRLMPAEPGVNEKGFWEDMDIYEINNEIFDVVGHDWHDLCVIENDLFFSSKLDKIKNKAIETVKLKLNNTDNYGIKDPKLTRILPFWLSVFEAVGVSCDFVIACRNPVDVAESMSKYTGFSFEKSCCIWFEYTMLALLFAKNMNSIVVSYDNLLNDPKKELQRMAQKLNLGFSPDEDAEMEFSNKFLDASLRHQNKSIDGSVLPKKMIDLYNLLFSLSNDELNFNDDRFALIMESLKVDYYFMSKLFTEIKGVESERAAFINHLSDTLSSVIVDRDSRIKGYSDLNDRYTDLNDRYTDLNDRYTDLNDRYTDLNDRYTDLNDRYTDLNDGSR